MCTQLFLKVHSIMNDELTETRCKAQALLLFHQEEPSTEDQVNNLTNTLFLNILSKVNAFLNTKEAQKLDRHAYYMDARSSYSSTIREKIHFRMEEVFHLSSKKLETNKTCSKVLGDFFWKILGF